MKIDFLLKHVYSFKLKDNENDIFCAQAIPKFTFDKKYVYFQLFSTTSNLEYKIEIFKFIPQVYSYKFNCSFLIRHEKTNWQIYKTKDCGYKYLNFFDALNIIQKENL